MTSSYNALKLAVAEMDPNPWHPDDVRAVMRTADAFMVDTARMESGVRQALTIPAWRWKKRDRLLREATRIRLV